MASTLRASDPIVVLDLPMRVYNALCRNNVRTIEDLVALSEVEFLRMRGIGATSLEELRGTLTGHGLSMPTDPPPPPDPATTAEAEWIGRQLDALSQDERVCDARPTWGRDEKASTLERRRLAWAFYRWGTTPDADWPSSRAGGFRYMAYALPGSAELHLEGLNRLAREELGDE